MCETKISGHSLFVVDVHFHKECLLALISRNVQHETGKEANVRKSF